ncbi:hypothetical protein QOT17_009319 [Balamuthia mandrillaris]
MAVGAKRGYAAPGWMLFWLYVGSLIVLWDASYILLRPRTMKGGDLETFWYPYQTYILADKRYGDLNDSFGIAQSWMNLVEVAICFIGLFQYHKGNSSAPFYFFVSQLMCGAKTVLYFLTEVCSGFEFTGHSLQQGDHLRFYTQFVLPSSFWVIFPLLVCISIGRHFIGLLKQSSASSSQNQNNRKKVQ